MLPRVPQTVSHLAEVLRCSFEALPGGDGAGPLGTASTVLVIVVDGLGHENLLRNRAYARCLSRADGERIETTLPSTTATAISTLTTGVLPGAHGMLGYDIWDERAGRMRKPLREWEGITDVREWFVHETLFERFAREGIRSTVLGRSAHAGSGLSAAMLTGARYLSEDNLAQRITRGMALATAAVRTAASDPQLVYVYCDELDRIAHRAGVASAEWVNALEHLDAVVAEATRRLPAGLGVVLTADHGIVDIPVSGHVTFDNSSAMDAVLRTGGEPRFRMLYLAEQADPGQQRAVWQEHLGAHARVWLREEAIAAGWFGEVAPGLLSRLGQLLLLPVDGVALYGSDSASAGERGMIGQHGGLSETERGVPLLRWGAFDRVAGA